ncbi:TlpA disulfide reductase family protein [Actinokineospora bangkokensis]|uniref:Alkyl hydroperoxide reductase n=1 Tax=Actinokineospora bangkokensis TaxID=1193682 RepID=A0A1Q9LFB5_9PSEU|nr:TlpA disulfide reductase family protein [Actinokineospora bangkokensis]OLR90731.1 alkyl hydroperoxide reductase [Actinokineospora bangkokensis]
MLRKLAAPLALLLALTACSAEKGAVANDTEFVFVSPGGKTDITYAEPDRKPLAQVAGPSLMDPDKQIALSDYRGKVVVLNVWGQWCGPCRTEAPELENVQETYGPKGVQVLGINFRDNDRQAPQDFVTDRRLTYPSIFDPPGRTLLALKGYPRAVVPATFLIDKQGRVAAAYMRDLLASDLTGELDKLVAE